MPVLTRNLPMPARLRTFVLSGALAALAPAALHASSITVDLGTTGESRPFSTQQPSLGLLPVVTTSGDFDQLGEIWWFAGNFAPRGTLQAAGQLLPIAGNDALFSRVGTRYGGDGRTTFALPDLRGRTPIGGAGFDDFGTRSGAEAVTLAPENLPEHDHFTATGFSSNTGEPAPAPFENRQPSLAVNYEVTQFGVFPPRDAAAPAGAGAPEGSSAPGNTFIASVSMFASTGAGPTTVDADGRLIPITSNPAFFSLLGDTYGGDLRTVFGVPDLDGRAVVGAGTGPGLTSRTLGAAQGSDTNTLTEATMPIHTHTDPEFGATGSAGSNLPLSRIQPELALNYAIALNGLFPSRAATEPLFAGDPVAALGFEPFLGEIGIFAGNFAPRGWAFAHGQLLPIASNTALFSLLGTTFGGDGRTTFALPDLRGRIPVGIGTGSGLDPVSWGQTFGSERTFLDIGGANLPPHAHTVERTLPPAPIPLPAGVWLLLGGLGGLIALRHRA
jgi:microcystin-dependent protein